MSLPFKKSIHLGSAPTSESGTSMPRSLPPAVNDGRVCSVLLLALGLFILWYFKTTTDWGAVTANVLGYSTAMIGACTLFASFAANDDFSDLDVGKTIKLSLILLVIGTIGGLGFAGFRAITNSTTPLDVPAASLPNASQSMANPSEMLPVLPFAESQNALPADDSAGDGVGNETESAASEANTKTYQTILEDYTKQLTDATPALVQSYKADAKKNTDGLQGLAVLSNQKITELAEISNAGIQEMAELMLTTGSGTYGEYEEWASDLMDVYMDEAQKIMDAYLESAIP